MIFRDKRIRRIWYKEDWFYSVVDVVGVLSESADGRKYWNKLSQRLREEGSEMVTICHRLKMRSSDGKKYMTDCVDLKGLFRIIQSIPSRKAEPFKRWLAKVGSERVDEMEDPELAIDRAMKNYLAKGYSEKWINQRIKTIEVRKELTDEWRRVGVGEGQEFAILTNEITLAWSGKSIRDYKDFKNLKKENLRDNMTNLELALNMLAETVTTEISKKEDPDGFSESVDVAVKGGEVAGNARRDIEDKLGESVLSRKNYLEIREKGAQKKKIIRKK